MKLTRTFAVAAGTLGLLCGVALTTRADDVKDLKSQARSLAEKAAMRRFVKDPVRDHEKKGG